MMLKTRDDGNIVLDWILYTQIIGYFRRNSSFSESKKQNRYISMNSLAFSMTSIFHVILVEKQLIKHDMFAHCLTFNFRHRSEYKSFPLVWRGLTQSKSKYQASGHLLWLYSQVCVGRGRKTPKTGLLATQLTMWLIIQPNLFYCFQHLFCHTHTL